MLDIVVYYLMMNFRRILCLVAIIVLVLPGIFLVGCRADDNCNAPHEFELRVFDLTNQQREAYGLPLLVWHDKLAVVAREHSRDMDAMGVMSHYGSDGSRAGDRIANAGITNIRGWSENVARGQLTPEVVVNAWMNSPSHRANILRASSTHLGVGFVESVGPSRFATYWTQKFISLEE